MGRVMTKKKETLYEMSSLERGFLFYFRIFASENLPTPTEQFRFHSTRRWRWDFSWPDKKLAIELQGGTWVHGRHSHGSGQSGDYEKHNAAIELGWTVLYYTTDMINKNPEEVIKQIERVLNK